MSKNQNPFQSFSFTAGDDVFNTPVGNSDYMPVGVHEVTVTTAEFEMGDYGPQIIVTFANEKGQTIKDYINLIAQNREEKKETGIRPHYKYLMFGQSLISDPISRLLLLQKLIPSNPNAIDCTKNTKLKVTVEEPTKGYTIKDVNGQKVILDIANNEYVGDEAYETFDAAKAAAETMGLKRGYNKVTKFQAVSQEVQDNNLAIMSPMLEPFKKAAAAPASRRPVARAGQPV